MAPLQNTDYKGPEENQFLIYFSGMELFVWGVSALFLYDQNFSQAYLENHLILLILNDG